MSSRKAAGGTVAVLEWQAWKGFLIAHVLGAEAVRIETDPFHEFPSAEFDRICDSATTVCFQINLSVRRRLPLRIRELTSRFLERGVYVVNGLVQDVRKSTLHAHLEAIGLASPKAAPVRFTLTKFCSSRPTLTTAANWKGGCRRRASPPAALQHLVSAEVGAYRYKTVKRGKLHEGVWHGPSHRG